MPNVADIIKGHNRNLLQKDNSTVNQTLPCNCRNKSKCPLGGKCGESSVIYKAELKHNGGSKQYIGSCSTTFKTRLYNHHQSFKDRQKRNATELSKAIWNFKDLGGNPEITWSIVRQTPPYQCGSRRCRLCQSEKLTIFQADNRTLLNKRSELISKCRHRNKYKLKNCP